MFKIRLAIALLVAAVIVPETLMAQYPSGDAGQYVIQNAEYGTPAHHVDVTARLKELARQDRTFRMGNSTFGVDPDPGHVKTLRIYARGANGQERTFDYQEGSVVDGSLFRAWGTGEWGNGQLHRDWDHDADDRGGYQGDHREAQPEMAEALQHLREAQRDLQNAAHNKGGHRQRALDLTNQAISEAEQGIQYDNTH